MHLIQFLLSSRLISFFVDSSKLILFFFSQIKANSIFCLYFKTNCIFVHSLTNVLDPLIQWLLLIIHNVQLVFDLYIIFEIFIQVYDLIRSLLRSVHNMCACVCICARVFLCEMSYLRDKSSIFVRLFSLQHGVPAQS